MRKRSGETVNQKLAVDTSELRAMLSCGRDTAVKVGTEAGARIQIGKRVLWNVDKVQSYIDKLSEGAVS